MDVRDVYILNVTNAINGFVAWTTTGVCTGTESCTVTVGSWVGTTFIGTAGTMNMVLTGMEDG